jgi:hypothetical protein
VDKKKSERSKDQVREALSGSSSTDKVKSHEKAGKFDEDGVFRSNEVISFVCGASDNTLLLLMGTCTYTIYLLNFCSIIYLKESIYVLPSHN